MKQLKSGAASAGEASIRTTTAPLAGRVLSFLFFCSGLTGLLIQILAIRILALLLGSTVHALSCAVTAFMLGLSLGSFMADWLRKKQPAILGCHGIRLYGLVTICVGAFAAAVFPEVMQRQGTILSFANHLTRNIGQLPSDVVVSAALLAIPTLLMGMTIPLAAACLPDRTWVPRLYAVNTVGAAVGSLVAAFVCIRFFGCRATAWMAGGINLAVGLTAFGLQPAFLTGARNVASDEPVDGTDGSHETASLRFICTLAFFSGFSFLACEMVWNRALTLVLGNRIYVTSITLFVVLLCLGIGARLGRALARRYDAVQVVAGAYLGSAVLLAIGTVLLPIVGRQAMSDGFDSAFWVLAHRLGLLTPMLVVLPAVMMGTVFPVLLSVRPRGSTTVDAHVGFVFAVNTVGAVFGGLAAGYGFLPILGAIRTPLCLAFLLLACCYAIAPMLDHRRRWLYALLAATVALLICGRAVRGVRSPYFAADELVMVQEDEHGIFQVVRTEDDRLRAFNDSTELVYHFGSSYTQFVQEMQAHVPMAFHRAPRRILNIGTGYGITAGAFTLYEAPRQIETVEIVPALIAAAPLFSSGNFEFFAEPRTTIHITDGRHFLASSREGYDIVSINISDPYTPGSSSLFSREFYEMVADHLNPGGIVCQHIFGLDNVSLCHEFKRNFPHVRAIKAYYNGVNLIGSREPLPPPEWNRLLDNPRRRQELENLGFSDSSDLADLLADGDEKLAEILAQPPVFVNTDDHPVLEFRTVPGELGFFHSNE